MRCQCLLFLALCVNLIPYTISLGQSDSGLTVSIKPHKDTLLLGEPLFVTTTVTNQGQQSIFLVYANGPSYALGQGLSRVLVANEHERMRSWSDELRPVEKVSPVELSAGQEITDAYVILYSKSAGFAFPTQGTYQITVEYVMKSGQCVRGNPVLITIQEPGGEDTSVWNNLVENGREYGLLVQTPWDSRLDQSAVDKLVAVHDLSVKSVYKQYLALEIGRYYTIKNEYSQAALFLQSANINSDNEILRKMIFQEIEIINQGILEAQVTLKPEALEVSPGILTAFVSLPVGFPVSGITTATCDHAAPERMMLSDDKTEMIMKFRRQDIEAALARVGESIDNQFVVRGTWKMGAAGTKFFQGTASIKKIVGAKSK